ncbi:thioredoxin family protein [Hyphobacterium sp.]|uniref:thioredoxin family protein n=1 Tax=Hyphobacterium sp. TaxID=2004662 RepID=UPI00374A16C9
MYRLWLAALCLLVLAAPVRAFDGETNPFNEAADARADVDAALARAVDNATRIILVFGADWCHDSHGLVDHFSQADMQQILSENYEVVHIDVGWRHRNLDIAREFGVPTIYGTPTVLIIDPDLGLVNRGTMHSWHTAFSRDHQDVVNYFRRFAYSVPGGGVVENSQTYAALVGQIEDWENREGARLSNAYVMLQEWRATLDDEFALAGNDEEATRIVELYHSVENNIDRHRGRMREDRNALYSEARERVRDALFELGSDLTPQLAAELDANSPDIALDFPDYGAVLFPWEDDGWAL